MTSGRPAAAARASGVSAAMPISALPPRTASRMSRPDKNSVTSTCDPAADGQSPLLLAIRAAVASGCGVLANLTIPNDEGWDSRLQPKGSEEHTSALQS